ncbi:MAG TPA: hypothetical protein VE890_12895 [Thermoguttaceae bacterium]|nr:hypothetical protein [Thermoguttaceae bacterium]
MLASFVLVLLVPIGLLGWAMDGMAGTAAASVAATLCFVGAALALGLSHLLRAPEHVLYGVLMGMAARMGIPLASGMVVHLHGGALAQSHFLHYLLVFFPVTLAVETFLSLPKTGPNVVAGSAIDLGRTCRQTTQDAS